MIILHVRRFWANPVIPRTSKGYPACCSILKSGGYGSRRTISIGGNVLGDKMKHLSHENLQIQCAGDHPEYIILENFPLERLAHDAAPFRDEVSVATLQSLQPHHSCEVNWQLSVASSMTRREQGRPCGGKKGLKLSGIREGQSNLATEDP